MTVSQAVAGYYMVEEHYVMPSVRMPDGRWSAAIEFSQAIRRTIDDSLVFRSTSVKDALTLLRNLEETTA